MTALPAPIPIVTPPLTIATLVLLLPHTPPLIALLNVVDEPTHSDVAPVIVPATGNGLTVTICVSTAVPQPFVTEYEIMTLPAATPLTTPPLTVAVKSLLLVQVPPPVALLNVIDEPTHPLLYRLLCLPLAVLSQILDATQYPGHSLTLTIYTLQCYPLPMSL